MPEEIQNPKPRKKPVHVYKPKLSPAELEYIRQNCLNMSDRKIAEKLGRLEVTVRKARVRLGVLKVSAGKVTSIKENNNAGDVNSIVLKASQKLNEDQRKEFFKTQLTNTLYYKKLKDQFTNEEMDFYLEEWGALCLQFEDIVATEKRQIDELIKVSIMGIRILRNIKIAEEEISNLQKEVDDFRKSHPNLEDDEELQERDMSLNMLIRTMSGQSHAMAVDYNRNLEAKNNILSELNARRKDRIDQLTKRGTTFLGLIAAFRERETRERHGRHIELVRLAKEKKKDEWRKPTRFPDNTLDCILMDDKSKLPEQEIVLLSDMQSNLVQKYSQPTNSKILVVDNDFRRQQFFADVFANNKIDFASNAQKALELLKNDDYNLVCLDYDLGLFDKGSLVSNYIIDNDICKGTDILIQSENKSRGKEMYDSLKEFRNTELVPFETIRKTFTKTD